MCTGFQLETIKYLLCLFVWYNIYSPFLFEKIWAGSKDGRIYLINSDTKKPFRILLAHDDAVRSLCNANDRYILSGSGSSDGKIAIWTPNDMRTESGTYMGIWILWKKKKLRKLGFNNTCIQTLDDERICIEFTKCWGYIWHQQRNQIF